MILLTSAHPPGTPQGLVTALQERATPSRGPQRPECSPGRSFRCRSPPLSPSLCARLSRHLGTWGRGACGSHLGVAPPRLCSSHLHRTPELTRRELRGCPFKTPPRKCSTDPERFLGLGIKDVTGLGPLPNAKYAGRSCRPMVPLGLPALHHLFPSHGPAGPSVRRRLQPGAGRSQRRGPDRAPPLCSRRNDDEPDFQVTKTRRQKEGHVRADN